ncbi:hypothetical protein IAU59_003618 [Kwoniella sp. CBS 9459]
MLQSADDAQRYLEQGPTLFGEGWECVPSFEELDQEEYEDEEEELYVTMDLGTTLDAKALQNETQYQLIGLDTPLPFLKIGNQIFQGEVTPLIGDEVILGLVRNHDNPQKPSHPPLHSTNRRLTFRAVTLQPRVELDQIRDQDAAAPAPASASAPTAAQSSEAVRAAIDPAAASTTTGSHDVFSQPIANDPSTPAENPGADAGAGTVQVETSSASAGPSTQKSYQPFLAPLPISDTFPGTSTSAKTVDVDQGAASGSGSDRAKGKGKSKAEAIEDSGDNDLDQAEGTDKESTQMQTQTQSGKDKPRKKWTKLQKVRVDDPKELESLDLDSMKPHQTIAIGPNVLETLGLPPSVPGLGVSLNKRELVKLLSGLPETGVGSRGGKGAKARRNEAASAAVAAAAATPSGEPLAGDDEQVPTEAAPIEGESHSQTALVPESTTTDSRAQSHDQDESFDVPMIDVEDDPPWQEIGDGDA